MDGVAGEPAELVRGGQSGQAPNVRASRRNFANLPSANAHRVSSQPRIGGHIAAVFPDGVIEVLIGRVRWKSGVNYRRVSPEVVVDNGGGPGRGHRLPSSGGIGRVRDPDLRGFAVAAKKRDEAYLPCVVDGSQSVAEGVAGMALIEHGFEWDVLFGDDAEFGDFKVQEASSGDACETCQVLCSGDVVDLDFGHTPTVDLEAHDRAGRVRAKVGDRDGDEETVSRGWCRNTLCGYDPVRTMLANAEVAVVGPGSDPGSLAVLA